MIFTAFFLHYFAVFVFLSSLRWLAKCILFLYWISCMNLAYNIRLLLISVFIFYYIFFSLLFVVVYIWKLLLIVITFIGCCHTVNIIFCYVFFFLSSSQTICFFITLCVLLSSFSCDLYVSIFIFIVFLLQFLVPILLVIRNACHWMFMKKLKLFMENRIFSAWKQKRNENKRKKKWFEKHHVISNV